MNKFKGFVCGFIAAFILMAGTSSFAETVIKTIQAAENAIKVKVNGSLTNVPNLVINGKTYIQVRALSELLGKNVSWDPNTGTASIDDKDSNVSLNQSLNTQVEEKELSTKEIAKKGSSVVLVKAYDENGSLVSLGSGFIVSSDGKVATNYHVVNEAYSVEVVTTGNKVYGATSVDYNENKDIAILRLQGASGLSALTLGDSSSIQLGEKVVAIGNPEGLQNVVSEGIVSTTNQIIDGHNYIQITAPISPGSSGGALFDSYGKVIGITAAKLNEGDSINFAVPINYIKTMLIN